MTVANDPALRNRLLAGTRANAGQAISARSEDALDHSLRELVEPVASGSIRDDLRGAAGLEIDRAGQPRNAVDDRPEIVAVSLLACTGVQAHPDPERPACRPVLRSKGPLGGKCCCDSGLRCPECRAKGIAHGLEDVAVRFLNRRPDQVIVPAQGNCHALGLGLPQPRRALDVGEEQRDSA